MQAHVIRHSQTSGRARAALMAVAYYVDRDEVLAYASNETLVVEQGISERVLQAGLRECEELGELQRQPQMEDYQRRRVYVIDPTFRRQAALPGLAELGAQLGAGRRAPARAPAPSRVGVREEQKEQENTPLSPPGGGAGRFASPSPFTPATPTDRNSVRADRRSRRSRSRRGRTSASDVPPAQPCPLAGAPPDDLVEQWRSLDERIAATLGPSWEIIARAAHPHRIEPDIIEVGLNPQIVAWTSQRWGRATNAIVGRPVVYVPCEAAS